MSDSTRVALRANLAAMLEQLGGRARFDALVDAVLTAGELGLKMYREGAGARFLTKPDRSPVTEADAAVERQLRAFVAHAFPDASFYGEEEGETGSGPVRFIVDPIDGTRAFMRGLPTWSTLVGVELAGEPVAGIAYMPAAGDLFWAVRGHGAYANGRPVHLSRVASLSDALLCHGGLAQFTDEGCEAALPALARGSYTQRGFGDFAGYRALLLGQADAVVDPGIKPYDVAAAAVLVREAGGRFTTMTGEESIYGPGAVASNGFVHAELLSLLASAAPR